MLFFIICYCNHNFIKAQILDKCIPFSSATPFQEPDGRRESIRIDDKTFVTISKIKGNIGGLAEFVLEKYTIDLENLFKTPIPVDGTEEIEEMFIHENNIILLSVIHQESQSNCMLKATTYDLETGVKKAQKVLIEEKIFPWISEKSRGAIKQSFNDMICAAIGRNYTTPPNYKIRIRYSPDKSLFAAYLFDYSQKSLNGKCFIFNKQLERVTSGNIHIDNNFTNYAVQPNNRGEVYIVNGDKSGRIAVVQYNLETRKYKYLDIQNASAKRESLVLSLLGDDIVYVANVIIGNNRLSGVMYSKFNFITNLVERVNFHDLSDGLRQTMEHSWEYVKQKSPDNWTNYEVSEFFVNADEEVIIALEKREIQTPAYPYEQSNTVEIQKWQECTGNVYTAGMFLFSFNNKDELKWENAYAKAQISDLNTGINTASYVMDNSHSTKFRALYSTSNNASGIFNTLNYLEWDKATGKKVKELQLPNDELLGLVRSYTQWNKNQLILVGRKGLLGKKSTMCSYKLE
ncbi:MAG: hypothetical protein EAZ07_00745 [Cytophagales bacterium]|nr:MAG: hypothetical protein EAZ07_00745 [Cytophagales bacterium]